MSIARQRSVLIIIAIILIFCSFQPGSLSRNYPGKNIDLFYEANTRAKCENHVYSACKSEKMSLLSYFIDFVQINVVLYNI